MARIARNDVLRRTEDALRAAYPDRATLLIREIKVRFWSPPGEGATADVPRCRFCGRSEKKVATLVWRLMCDECLLVCHELSLAIDAGAPRPSPDAALSDAVRAIRAAGDTRADEVVSELEARVLVQDDLTGRGLPPICSHCGVRHDESRMVRGPRVWICTPCVQEGMREQKKELVE